MSPSPLSVKKNNYIKNTKRSDIETPIAVCEFLHEIITNNYMIKTILDPCCGNRNLTKPFKEAAVFYDFDIKRGSNFLTFDSTLDDVDLVTCNPPFNLGVGRKLGSEVFLQKIIEVTSPTTPIVLFCPMGFRLNIRGTSTISKRYARMEKAKAKITSIVSLPLDIFEGVQFHSEILLFNMPKLEPHYWLPTEVCRQIQLRRAAN